MKQLSESVKVVSTRRTTARKGLLAALDKPISIQYMCMLAPDLFCSSTPFFDSLKSQERTSLISLYREVSTSLVSDSRSRQ